MSASVFLVLFLRLMLPSDEKPLITSKGKISFLSDAPLEKIQASSNQLRGLLNPGKKTFAFSVAIGTFEGFNSDLQREHFNENYMEAQRFPQATFTGKLLDDISYSEKKEQKIRVKGQLSVHGISKERILEVVVKPGKNKLDINARFEVPLADHQIEIPRLVYQKIAEIIEVNVQAQLAEE